MREVFGYDKRTGELYYITGGNNRVAGASAGGVVTKGYIQVRVDGVAYMAHRIIWMWVKGKIPDCEIDHRNGVKGDNRIENLREATDSQNSQNQHRAKVTNKSGYLGVSRHRRKWRAIIKPSLGSKSIILGSFDSPEDASAAYQAAKSRLHFYRSA